MHAPDFWWRSGTGNLLTPLAAVYGAVAGLRMQWPGRRAGLPVICVGNLTVGGAGKTPAALAVGHLLLAAGERVFFLTRGYGGRLSGPVRVRPQSPSGPVRERDACMQKPASCRLPARLSGRRHFPGSSHGPRG